MQHPRKSEHEKWWQAPVMTGALVRLEPLSLDHVPGLALQADETVFKNLLHVCPTSEEAMESIVRMHLDNQTYGRIVPWAQISLADGSVAGTTAFYDIDPFTGSLAIGHTWIGQRYQRTGLNRDAKYLLLSRAFDELGATRVIFHTDVRNMQSQRAIEGLGAQREGVLRKHRLRPDGSWRDTIQYSIINDDWPSVAEFLRPSQATAV